LQRTASGRGYWPGIWPPPGSPPEPPVSDGVDDGAAQLGSGAAGLTTAIGVGAGRGAAGFGAAGFGAACLTAFFAFVALFAFLAGAARRFATRLALRFGARRATARFFALDFFFAFLFFLAMSSSPAQVMYEFSSIPFDASQSARSARLCQVRHPYLAA